MSNCPYCKNERVQSLGTVYCSKETKNMKECNHSFFTLKTNRLEETDWHTSRLSVRMVLKGSQYYKVDDKECMVRANNFLIINEGQSFKTCFDPRMETEMMMIGIKSGFAENVLHSYILKHSCLLDDDFSRVSSARFFDKTYPTDEPLYRLMYKLKRITADQTGDFLPDVDELYASMILRIHEINSGLRSKIESIDAVKPGTRLEIYKRLERARDFMESNYNRKLNLNDIATAAFLSVHYFRRIWKEIYNITPHNYLLNIRMQRANALLKNTSLSVAEITTMVGFENNSSFIRSFKQFHHISPLQFRAHIHATKNS